ncbi:CoA transferase [Gordonia terrae]
MWPHNKQLPHFGPLAGVKVVHATASVAGPFSVQMLADNGADVIWIENPSAPDMNRFTGSTNIEAERRNQRGVALNISSEEGVAVFLDLIRHADVFVESSKGGQYARWGLTDEELWKVNKKLVICHISGFGQSGLPEYVKRPSFDMVAQAFSGYMHSNIAPGSPPFAVGPVAGDYFTALFATAGILMALRSAELSGVGDSVDVAQFECLLRASFYSSDWFTNNAPVASAGEPSLSAGVGCYKCKDGAYVQLVVSGTGGLKNVCKLFGLEYGTADIPEGVGVILRGTAGGDKIDEAAELYMSARTADQASADLLAAGVAAQKINTPQDVMDDPHVQARGTLQKVTTNAGRQLTYVGAVPQFSRHPSNTWRPAPWTGMDNEEVLKQLGYDEERISKMYSDGIIGRKPVDGRREAASDVRQ